MRTFFKYMKRNTHLQKLLFLTACMICLGGFTTFTFAQPGTLDTNFGSGGKRLTNISTADDEILATAIQPDNKIIVVGYSEKPAQFTIARYSNFGNLDSTFGTGGIVKTAFNGTGFANSVIIQSDGKIVLGGMAENKFALVRYNSSGQIDSSFGNQGKVLTTIGNSSAINDITIQSDGKIIAAGYTEKLADFAVARYNSNGTLDTTFGSGGIVITDFFNDDDRATSVSLQSDGKIVVGGGIFDLDLLKNFAVVRYNSNGSLDTSFNGDGKKTTFVECGDEALGCGIDALGLQSDGKIVVTGSAGDIYLARYNTNGSLDTTFGNNGIVITNLGGNYDNAYDLAIDMVNGILVAGSTISSGDEDMVVAKYTSNGTLDTTFDNGDGIVTISLGSNSDISYSLSLQPNGGIVLGGSQGNFGSKQFATVRLIGLQPTAANASISGKVTSSNGIGISQVRVSLTDSQGITTYVMTSSFGYYTFNDVPVGQTYILTPNSVRYSFTPTSMLVSLTDDYTGADFIAD